LIKRGNKIRTSTRETKTLLGFSDSELAGDERLLSLEKSNRASIQSVIAANYLDVTGINFSF
jgi:hypothetical protein